MQRFHWFYLCMVVLAALPACQSNDSESLLETVVSGQLTVDADVDSSGDYAGFELNIIEADTLFHAITDKDGQYEGVARFSRPGLFPLMISRNGNDLAVVELVLAGEDTVQLGGEFPNFEESFWIESVENDLFQSYQRLESGAERVMRYASVGLISADSLRGELAKWSDLFWNFYSDNEDAFAGGQAAMSSIQLLEGVADSLMMERLQWMVEEDPQFVPFAAGIGVRFHARSHNLDQALAYMDSLDQFHSDEEVGMRLKRNRIKLLYDSARVETARLELDQFRETYGNVAEAQNWMERFESDLTWLAPGSPLPDFHLITTDGDTLSRDGKKGSPYILEFTRLDNLLYQEQFDRNVAIHHIYKNYGISFITIPFASNPSLLDAFFEERAHLWSFAIPGSFDPEELREVFNLNIIPTRILVDEQGNVVRKYEGTEYNDIIKGLQIVLNNHQEEPS